MLGRTWVCRGCSILWPGFDTRIAKAATYILSRIGDRAPSAGPRRPPAHADLKRWPAGDHTSNNTRRETHPGGIVANSRKSA
jgi:hypothetical protein